LRLRENGFGGEQGRRCDSDGYSEGPITQKYENREG